MTDHLVKHLVIYDEYLYLSVDGRCEEKGKEHVTYTISFLQIRIQWWEIHSNSQRPDLHISIINKKTS